MGLCEDCVCSPGTFFNGTDCLPCGRGLSCQGGVHPAEQAEGAPAAKGLGALFFGRCSKEVARGVFFEKILLGF